MTQSDQLHAGFSQIATDLDAVAAAIDTEKEQLAEALANASTLADLRAAAQATIDAMGGFHTRLTGMTGSLASDDAVAGPPSA